MTWDSLKFKFVKKISLPNSVKAMDTPSATSGVLLDFVKAIVALSDTIVSRSSVEWEDQLNEKTGNYTRNQKGHISQGD